MEYVSKLFDPEPDGVGAWGLRGDPFLYADMKKAFSQTPLPISETKFKDEYERYFLLLTGHSLFEKDNDIIRLEKYSHEDGGMSAGCVSSIYWKGKILLRLLERLMEYNSGLTK